MKTITILIVWLFTVQFINAQATPKDTIIHLSIDQKTNSPDKGKKPPKGKRYLRRIENKKKRVEKKEAKQEVLSKYYGTIDPESDDEIFIDFVGNGNLQKAVSQGSDLNANTGIGIIMERYNGNPKFIESFDLEGTINVASTADTVIAEIKNNSIQNRRDFGTYILNPVSAKQSLFANANLYFKHKNTPTLFKGIGGANIRVISSNAVWEFNDTIAHLGAFSLRAGPFYEFITKEYRRGEDHRIKYSVFLGINYSYRMLIGDLSANKYESLRTSILGTTQTRFHGWEANFGFRVNNLRAEFQMSQLYSKRGELEIEGLTKTQFIFSIRFVGGFPISLKKNSEKPVVRKETPIKLKELK